MVRVIIEVEAEEVEDAVSLLGGLVTDLNNGWTFIERVNETVNQKMVVIDPDDNDQTAFPQPAKKAGK